VKAVTCFQYSKPYPQVKSPMDGQLSFDEDLLLARPHKEWTRFPLEPHFGHFMGSSTLPIWRSSSNLCPHFSHLYSYSGKTHHLTRNPEYIISTL